jgi:hypothetical protein
MVFYAAISSGYMDRKLLWSAYPVSGQLKGDGALIRSALTEAKCITRYTVNETKNLFLKAGDILVINQYSLGNMVEDFAHVVGVFMDTPKNDKGKADFANTGVSAAFR